jgi:hypothetical protein
VCICLFSNPVARQDVSVFRYADGGTWPALLFVCSAQVEHLHCLFPIVLSKDKDFYVTLDNKVNSTPLKRHKKNYLL